MKRRAVKVFRVEYSMGPIRKSYCVVAPSQIRALEAVAHHYHAPKTPRGESLNALRERCHFDVKASPWAGPPPTIRARVEVGS